MQLLASWRDSLKIVYPLDNLKLFFLASLRAIQVAAPKVGIVLGVALVICQSLWYTNFYAQSPFSKGLIIVLFLWMYFFIQFLIYFLVRPSVGLKDISYWYGHRMHLIRPFVRFFILSFLGVVLMAVPGLFVIKAFFGLWVLVLFIGMPLMFLFFLDSRGSFFDPLYAVFNAVRMAVYNLPIWLVLACARVLVQAYFWEKLLTWPVKMGFFGALFLFAAWLIVQFVAACVWSVFYTKRLHEQFELYFPSKNK